MRTFEEYLQDSDDMGPVKSKEKTITVKHKTSGKKLVVTAKSLEKYKKMGYIVEKINSDTNFTSSEINRAIKIAKELEGDLTGATEKIEKIKKGLSDQPKVAAALRSVNEDI